MRTEKQNIYIFLCITIVLLGCSTKPNSVNFSIITSDSKVVEISKVVNDTILNNYMNSSEAKNFQKLTLTQANGDNLIVEQKDENGYLILINYGHEQFVIESQPSNLSDVTKLMNQYLIDKDGIMTNTKFY